MEHAWGDGVAVLRYVNDIFKDSIEKPFIRPNFEPSSIDQQTVKCLGTYKRKLENLVVVYFQLYLHSLLFYEMSLFIMLLYSLYTV